MESPLFLSPVFYFLGLTVFYLLAHGIARHSAFFSKQLATDLRATTQIFRLDGLRGLLAISVFFSHAVISYFYWMTGSWGLPPSPFYASLGGVPVLLFFCLSGFLFWNKLLSPKKPIVWSSFYFDRIKRLCPGYFLAVSLAFLMVGVETGFKRQVDLGPLVSSMLRWLSFGLPFASFPALNGFSASTVINAGVFWTLTYEWLFYLSLPVLGFFARGNRLFLLLAGTLSLYLILRRGIFAREIVDGTAHWLVPNLLAFLTYLASGFGIGMFGAHCRKRFPHSDFGKRPVVAVFAVVCFLVALAFPLGENSVRSLVLERLLIGTFFFSIVFGNTLFGLLESRAFRLMGLVSYSVYVLHGIFLYGSFLVLSKFSLVNQLNTATFWLFTGAVGLAVVALSAVSYRWIEHPFLVRPIARNDNKDVSQAPEKKAA